MRRDRFLGVIQMLNKQYTGFSEADVSLLLVLGLVSGIVIDAFESRIEAGTVDKEDFYY